MTLLSGLQIQLSCLGVVLRNDFSLLIANAEIILGLGCSLISCCAQPLYCLGFGVGTKPQEIRKIQLRLKGSLLCCLTKPLNALRVRLNWFWRLEGLLIKK